MIESADEYVRLRESNDGAAWQRIKREEAPLQVWLDIIRNHPDMRFWVTFNRTVPVQVLREISGDPDWRVRAKIASNRHMPEDLIDSLSRDEHDAVVSSAAGNPRCPASALRRLLEYPWDQVREKARRQLAERDLPEEHESGGEEPSR